MTLPLSRCAALALAVLAGGAAGCADPQPTGSAEADETATGAPPPALACIARHFVGSPKSTPAGWVLALPSGTDLAWDDGRTKTYDEKLASPDLEDTLSIPYRTGAIAPVTTANDDPGRIRNDELYRGTYGASKEAVEAKMVRVDFLGQKVSFHQLAAPALARVATRLTALVHASPSLRAFVVGDLGGTFNWRVIANTTRLSAHSFATAIDIVVAKSDYWQWEESSGGRITWTNQIPQAIVDAFEAEGFAWGGRWYHYDTMHFEYRPELFDGDCKPQ